MKERVKGEFSKTTGTTGKGYFLFRKRQRNTLNTSKDFIFSKEIMLSDKLISDRNNSDLNRNYGS